ncbi:hypothetical protein [Leptospira interrogans]|uniref:hypothetical protein n=1 Tax=Leptospira interrogans TaxID=173 RepID=UPI00037700F9|nr:hypothetical protein [Leptospira interrogans]
MSRTYKQAFAIIRIDNFKTDLNLANRITIKKIVWDLKTAKNEVNRLNSINSDVSDYFWQTTRVEIK